MIYLSAGHYPAAPGAKFERFIEHDEAVFWVARLGQLLNGKATTVPTGILKDKVGFINTRCHANDLAVEIHFNDATKWLDKNKDGQVTDDELVHVGEGCETLYMPGSERSKQLAIIVEEALNDLFPFRWVDRNKDGQRQPDEFEGRGVKEGWYRMDPARGPDFFLARTRCPAVIVEPEFVQRKDRILENREAACLHLAAALAAAEHDLA